MADVDSEKADVEEQPKPARSKPKKKAGGGGGSPLTAIAIAVAIAAIGFSVFLFMQMQDLRKQILIDEGDIPRGANGEHAGTDETGSDDNTLDLYEPNTVANYELGDITANTADREAAVMRITLKVDSPYDRREWEAYQGELRRYDEELQFYLDYQAGKVDEKGEPIEGSHARHAGIVLAQHGAPPPTSEPPERPILPDRPRTMIEQAMIDDDAMVRNVIINNINHMTSDDLVSPAGEERFKQVVVSELNEEFTGVPGTIVGMDIGAKITT